MDVLTADKLVPLVRGVQSAQSSLGKPTIGTRLAALSTATALLLSGCAETMRRVEPPRPAAPIVYTATPPEILRDILIKNARTFEEIFKRLPASDVQALVGALPEQPEEQKRFKDSLQGTNAEQTKTKVLGLADTSANFGARDRDTPTRRQNFVSALSETALQKLALELIAYEKDRDTFCVGKRPRIHNIGIQQIITFEKKPMAMDEEARERAVRIPVDGTRAVRIPVDGRDLHPRCVTFEVTVTGTMPLSYGAPVPLGNHKVVLAAGDILVNKPSDEEPDTANVLLLERLIKRLKTRDQLTIQVAVSQHDRYGRADKERVVSFATRTFTLYEVEDYRDQVLRSRIAPHDLRAFPLPEEDVELLFGSLVAHDFFVVRLSVRNTESEAKLISTGMITAYGRLLVEPVGDEHEPSFTLPVMVVPSSLQQTFTILDDEEANRPRAWTFRALEFVGVLASAATSAFGLSLDVSKGISLFTGVGIPGGQKLFPDRWPGYKRNVVAYGMPDLIKVAANSVTDHRFLFFPKKDIELVIADHNMFPDSANKKVVERLDRTSRYFYGKNVTSVAPNVRVISLAFDNLDVRFEKVTPPATVKPEG